ncbi:MAG: peptide chain release factor-like protein [Longimicrobiales bacterium]|jgi:protein subunit release factor A
MDDVQPPDFIIPDGDDELLAQCRVETFRAGGPGGQHQNTTDSAVRLVHLPTGLRTTARDERSQLRNKMLAIARLRAKLEERVRRRKPRVPTKVPRSQKTKRADAKRKRGQTKHLRKPPSRDTD